jgi:predicted peptidase
LVFLHGYGGSGDGSGSQLRNLLETGIPTLIQSDDWPGDRPFVVLAPQHDFPRNEQPYAVCDEEEPFWGSCLMDVQHQLAHPADSAQCMPPAEVHGFLTYAIASYEVDPTRVYLTGLSCGAYAAYEYVAEYGATQIAAMVPIAGDARPAFTTAGCRLADVAIWAFHGDADDVVDPKGSTQPITSLRDCPQPPRRELELTVYPGVDHDSWTRTYDLSAGDDIYGWLLGFTVP